MKTSILMVLPRCGAATAAAAQTHDCAETFLCAPQNFDVTDVACRTPVGDGTVGALSVTVNEDGATGRLDYAFDPDVQSFAAAVTEGDGIRWLTATDDPEFNRVLALHFTGQAVMMLTSDFGGNFGATAIFYQCGRR